MVRTLGLDLEFNIMVIHIGRFRILINILEFFFTLWLRVRF